MTQFWYTIAGRTFVEHTMPEIARHLGRIAAAVEDLAVRKVELSAAGTGKHALVITKDQFKRLAKAS